MAPERWQELGINDPRSDIYSVGAVAYCLLSGRDIYVNQNPVQLLEQIIAGNIKPLAELPTALENLVMSCLAKDASNRPDSVSLILEQMEQWAIDDPWNQEKARAWWQSQENQPWHLDRRAWVNIPSLVELFGSTPFQALPPKHK